MLGKNIGCSNDPKVVKDGWSLGSIAKLVPSFYF